ncbi:hypothetical protein N7539_006642 [Penicillium diatomitis]|uniref:Uncharacterized protein n=1 Tax=Penicillium diatomitis TaxID=2819901 RepID=A0A9W9X1P8_9EURO|nr:uncharacterized protein N7539_006642 [Penicillium diatomitis]KAJ5480748.1 hypothetical protein N7539_006642 [Penicillium diatomitis]
MGIEELYLYMSYASQFQDVLHNYGTANLKTLQDIAQTYRPQRIFRTLETGVLPVEWAGRLVNDTRIEDGSG